MSLLRGSIANPFVTLSRQIRWRAHWMRHPEDPFVARGWWDGITLLLPRSGSAAVAFYRTFPSRTIANWMLANLRPGMTVIDVGAHVGVYAFLAARLVSEQGVVHAIEPQDSVLSLLAKNVELNTLLNVKIHRLAFSDSNGTAGLCINPRSLGAFTSSINQGGDAMVQTTTIETFVGNERLHSVGLMKLDAAGNEFAVLRGGRALLERGRVERIICKLYHPDVVAERFGEDERAPYATVRLLHDCGYIVVLPGGHRADSEKLDTTFAKGMYSVPVLATRSVDSNLSETITR